MAKGAKGKRGVEVGLENAGLATLRSVLSGLASVSLTKKDYARIDKAAEAVARIADAGETVYGINTGFGLLAKTTIERGDLEILQEKILLSHAAGVGPPLSDPVVRLAMVLKILGLARGYSGVRRQVIDHLAALVAGDVCPVVPSKGSVGASGDLAPLAHLAGVLIGLGEARISTSQHPGRKVVPAVEALASIGLEPLTLGPKEGLALINGTQISTALALDGLVAFENLFAGAMVAGALSVDANKGSDRPFDARIHEVRGQAGQRDVAAVYRALLDHSAIRDSHADCDRVQDPYCLRCQPQVMGAALDMMRFAAGTLEREAIAVSDNPLIFEDEVLSGGNFHAEPVAMAADVLAIAIAETGNISERRIALMMDPHMSGLPPFLVKNSGLNSGFMMAQVTAAALASENKQRAHPASVDSIPTSANQEDHVSMATHAALRLGDMTQNATNIIAIELLTAVQGIEYHAPLTTSAELQGAAAMVRALVPALDEDRRLTPDIELVADLVRSGAFRSFTSGLLPSDLPSDES